MTTRSSPTIDATPRHLACVQVDDDEIIFNIAYRTYAKVDRRVQDDESSTTSWRSLHQKERDQIGDAVRMLELAAERHHIPSTCVLAIMHERGNGVEQNPERARNLLGLSRLNEIEREVQASLPDELRQECERIVALIHHAAEIHGHAGSLAELGLLYDQGLAGRPVDQVRARELYENAASQGHLQAIVNLAIMHHTGTGGAADLSQARALYERAIDAGYQGEDIKVRRIHSRRQLGHKPHSRR